MQTLLNYYTAKFMSVCQFAATKLLHLLGRNLAKSGKRAKRHSHPSKTKSKVSRLEIDLGLCLVDVRSLNAYIVGIQ